MPKRILIDDDGATSRTLISKALCKYNVAEVENGVDAIKKIGTRRR